MAGLGSGSVCQVCGSAEGSLSIDTLIHSDSLSAHYFCLLFSSGLGQRGTEAEGIRGFLAADIRKEMKRGARLKCVYCRKKGATVGCAEQKCKKSYHLPCGTAHSSLQQYYDQFKSFCREHRPYQKARKEAAGGPAGGLCTICQDKIVRKATTVRCVKSLWSPCCGSHFHRDCLQSMAVTAGLHHFRCPHCQNTDAFVAEMRLHGIYVPEQDAAWERDRQFEDVDEEPVRACHAKICFCDKEEGRLYHKPDGLWEVLKCNSCGSKGIHARCAGLQNYPECVWTCYTCRKVLRSRGEKVPDSLPHTGHMWNPNRMQSEKFKALLASIPPPESSQQVPEKEKVREYEHKVTITPVNRTAAGAQRRWGRSEETSQSNYPSADLCTVTITSVPRAQRQTNKPAQTMTTNPKPVSNDWPGRSSGTKVGTVTLTAPANKRRQPSGCTAEQPSSKQPRHKITSSTSLSDLITPILDAGLDTAKASSPPFLAQAKGGGWKNDEEHEVSPGDSDYESSHETKTQGDGAEPGGPAAKSLPSAAARKPVLLTPTSDPQSKMTQFYPVKK